MTQHDFNILLEKYLAGSCSAEEEKIVIDWYERNAEITHELLTEDEKISTKNRIWSKIRKNTFGEKNLKLIPIWQYLGIAASILVFLSLGLYMFSSKKTSKDLAFSATDIEVKNNSKTPQEITLEDGSVVVLQPNSKLSYPEHFGDVNRQVYLFGDAMFEVKRNPQKPFLVITGKVTTEVLGTSFIVKSGEKSKSVEIEVLTGKVSVYENTEKESNVRNGAILTPNQKVVFNKETKTIVVGIVEEPKLVKVQNETEFSFDDTSLSDVLAVFKKNYQLEFFIENPNLNKCIFTADLNGLPMFTQLDFVCKTINAQYEIRGTSIFIFGEGCEAPSK